MQLEEHISWHILCHSDSYQSCWILRTPHTKRPHISPLYQHLPTTLKIISNNGGISIISIICIPSTVSSKLILVV
jgi:hypothetical protein